MKREFLQLAYPYDGEGIGGYLASEKLDGMRAFWDGGISRGQWKNAVPWANLAKDERYVRKQEATGLWSRYGNVIHAPAWFLDKLPPIMLDGEIYGDGGFRQNLMSIIKKLEAGDGWESIQYQVFDAPPISVMFEPGKINNTNFQKVIGKECLEWVKLHGNRIVWTPDYYTGFTTRLAGIRNRASGNEAWKIHEQVELPQQTDGAVTVMNGMLEGVLAHGGEGLIVRAPHATYQCGRVHTMLKIKECDDAEGTVVGYITGRETDKGSKLLGLMGALVLRLDNGKEMELSGFTDEERQFLASPDGIKPVMWARENPGQRCPDWIHVAAFPRGSRVTFKYRGTSEDGIPQEARYWRKA